MDAKLREHEEDTSWIVTEIPGKTGGKEVSRNGATGTKGPTEHLTF